MQTCPQNSGGILGPGLVVLEHRRQSAFQDRQGLVDLLGIPIRQFGVLCQLMIKQKFPKGRLFLQILYISGG